MPVVAISSDSHDKGQEIARRVAGELGYELVERSFLAELARAWGCSSQELDRALEEPPGLWPWRARRRRRHLLNIQAACLERLLADEVVCFGLGAHLYLQGVSHALRVRILEEPTQRAAELARARGLPPQRAAKLLESRDRARRRWSGKVFGSDETDPAGYDMVLALGTLEVEQAVELIREAAHYPRFQAMTYSRQCLRDKALASRVRGELLPRFPAIQVRASDGTVVARMPGLGYGQSKKREVVRQLAMEVPGVNYVEVHLNKLFGQPAQG